MEPAGTTIVRTVRRTRPWVTPALTLLPDEPSGLPQPGEEQLIAKGEDHCTDKEAYYA